MTAQEVMSMCEEIGNVNFKNDPNNFLKWINIALISGQNLMEENRELLKENTELRRKLKNV